QASAATVGRFAPFLSGTAPFFEACSEFIGKEQALLGEPNPLCPACCTSPLLTERRRDFYGVPGAISVAAIRAGRRAWIHPNRMTEWSALTSIFSARSLAILAAAADAALTRSQYRP